MTTETIDTAQPEALRLLQWYDEDGFAQGTKAPSKWVLQAAAELRRLHSALAAAEARNATLTDDAARWKALAESGLQLLEMRDQRDERAKRLGLDCAAASISTKGDGNG